MRPTSVDNAAPTVTLARADAASTTLAGAFDVTVTFTEANGLQTAGAGAFTASDLDRDQRQRHGGDRHDGPAGMGRRPLRRTRASWATCWWTWPMTRCATWPATATPQPRSWRCRWTPGRQRWCPSHATTERTRRPSIPTPTRSPSDVQRGRGVDTRTSTRGTTGDATGVADVPTRSTSSARRRRRLRRRGGAHVRLRSVRRGQRAHQHDAERGQ